MRSSIQLSSEEMVFFDLVAEAAFANPFSDRRVDLDQRIGGGEGVRDPEERIKLQHQAVHKQLSLLQQRGLVKVGQDLDGKYDSLRIAILFLCFHDFKDPMDQLIEKQIQENEASIPVPFAKVALDQLQEFGFSLAVAASYFAMFYQLRRAYYFIDHKLIGSSECMKTLRKQLWNTLFTHDIRLYTQHLWNKMEDFSTLLLGETGTGKGAAAAAIGHSGYIAFDQTKMRFARSFTSTFLSINLSQFVESLIESELFGHKKGAFTGAIDQHDGLFARSMPNGVVFLDEVGDVSIPIQIKLLRILQERTFTPVGSHENRRFNGRVVAATNRDLTELRECGKFRDDFYYRLSSDLIHIPPLRDRIRENPAELEQLTRFLLARMTGQAPGRLIDRVMERLTDSLPAEYAWSGNVRELEQAIRQILLRDNYLASSPSSNKASWVQEVAAGALDARQLLSAYARMLYDQEGTYEEVARRMQVDRRTVKKYIQGEA